MVNPWYNIKNGIQKNRFSLRSFGVGIIFFLILSIYTLISDIPLCPIKNVFGISCLGCGMSRAFLALIKLDFISAIKYNVLSIPLLIGIIIYCVLLTLGIIFNQNYIEKFEKLLSMKYLWFIYLSMLIVSAIVKHSTNIY